MKFEKSVSSLAITIAMISLSACGGSTPPPAAEPNVPPAKPPIKGVNQPDEGQSENPSPDAQPTQVCHGIDKPIGFKATGIYKDLFTLQGGDIPAKYSLLNSPYKGEVVVIDNGSIGRYSTLPGRPLGSISMNLMPVAGDPAVGAPGSALEGPVDAVGVVNISPEYRKKIMIDAGIYQASISGDSSKSNPSTTPNPQTTPCVNGISFSLRIGNGERLGGSPDSTLYGGMVIVDTTIGPIYLNF